MLRFLCPVIVFCGLTYGGEFAPANGDRIVWIGDSITHQCKYTQYIENFLYTRFHDKRLRFFAAGIKGDDAGNVLDRFDEDVAFFEPNWATLLLGMNDGRYQAFEEENFELYQSGMGELLDRLNELGTRAIPLSPSMFDHEQYDFRNLADDFRFKRINPDSGYNEKLSFYGGWLQTQSRERGLDYIDFWKSMNTVTDRFRKSDPRFTLMPDSIHPNPNGMAIMAGEMAAWFGKSRPYANRVLLRIDGDGVASFLEGQGEIESSSRSSFEGIVRPQALPWTLPATEKMGPGPWYHVDDPRMGFAVVMDSSQAGEDRLQASGLSEGSYAIYMNGEWILDTDSEALASGLPLEGNAKTPGYRQSLALALLNAERNDLAMRPYRDVQQKMKTVRRNFQGDPEAIRAERLKIEPELRRLFELTQAYEDRIHELAVPRPYRLEIRRVE